MELWRWVQASPAVHLVSRQVPTALPGFPNGLVLHDVGLARSRLRGRSEETLFVEDPVLAQRLRRGLSFAETVGGEGGPTLIRRGLPKFFDLDVEAFANSLQATGLGDPLSQPGCFQGDVSAQNSGAEQKLRQQVADSLVQRVSDAWRAGRRILVSRLEKANGENAQVSYMSATGQWVLCSKNVSLLASAPSEVSLPQWSDHRYRFARHVAELWFDQLGRLEERGREALREALAARTLVGELVGGSGAHLVDYGALRSLRWFAVVPHDSPEACWAPSRSLAFLQGAGLPTVASEQIGPATGCGSPSELLGTLRAASEAAEAAPLAEAGEGFVLYFVSVPEGAVDLSAASTVWLGKLKTAEYRLLRRVCEKAKHFARGAGCILVEDVLTEFRRE
ncbi:unnamed protein product, partial [Polarella glacialis]